MKPSAVLFFAALLVPVAGSPEPCHGQNESSESGRSDVTVSVTPAGLQRHVAGRWAIVAVNGTNRSDTDVEETMLVSVGDDAQLQFSRRMWIPAGARRQSYLPIRIPDGLLPSDVFVPMTSMRLTQTSGGEKFQGSALGLPTIERTLLLSWEEYHVATLLDLGSLDNETSYSRNQRLTDAIYAASDAADKSLQDLALVNLSANFLPPTPQALDALDQIVVGGDRIFNDSTAASRLRSWIQSGGRAWIMLDQVNPDLVRQLLGDASCYSVVDRVELNDFEMESTQLHATASKPENEPWSSDQSVEMVRVFAETDDVQCRVSGWPAAFWKQFGQGEILFTTLGTDGWMNSGEPTLAYDAVATRFFISRNRPRSQSERIAKYLQNDIGYTIPRRSLVAWALGIHVFAILLFGIWCFRRQRLQQMAIVVPLASVLAACGLVALGKQHTGAVPSTIAIGQIAQAVLESPQVHVDSVAAIYSQEQRELKIDSSADTTAMLAEEDLQGETKRIQWTDDGRSEWMFVSQAPGVVRNIECRATVALPQAWSVKGRFTADGFQADVDGLDVQKCEDSLIIAAPAPSLALRRLPSGGATFRGGAADVLAKDQYIDDTLMSGLQSERQDLLRELMMTDTPPFGPEPSFVTWTEPIDSGVRFDDNFQNRGWALASIPIQYEPLPSGSAFQVPASFARLKAVGGMSTVFNASTGRWLQDMNKAIATELQVVVPKILLPCVLERANVAIKISAPSRTLEIKSLIDGEYQSVYRKQDPNRLLEFTIDDPDALQLDGEGGLRLLISVSDSDQDAAKAKPLVIDEDAPAAIKPAAPNQNTWQIEYLQVSLEGTTR